MFVVTSRRVVHEREIYSDEGPHRPLWRISRSHAPILTLSCLHGTLEEYVSLSIIIHLDPHISFDDQHNIQTILRLAHSLNSKLRPLTSSPSPIPISQLTTHLLPPIPTNHPYTITPSPSSIKARLPPRLGISPSQHPESVTPSHPPFQNPQHIWKFFSFAIAVSHGKVSQTNAVVTVSTTPMVAMLEPVSMCSELSTNRCCCLRSRQEGHRRAQRSSS